MDFAIEQPLPPRSRINFPLHKKRPNMGKPQNKNGASGLAVEMSLRAVWFCDAGQLDRYCNAVKNVPPLVVGWEGRGAEVSCDWLAGWEGREEIAESDMTIVRTRGVIQFYVILKCNL